MNPQEQVPLNYEDEINLYDLWKVIVKRKAIIIGLFLVSILLAAVITFNMPKIYRGEVILRVTTKDTATAKEIGSIVGKIDSGKMALILPKTSQSITDLKLNPLKDSTDKMQVTIDSKKADEIPDALSELIQYIKSNPLMKRAFAQERERLLKQSEELSKTIDSSGELVKTYRKLLDAGRLNPIGFNPIELNKRVSDLKIEKLNLEQALENLKGVEPAGELYISKKPVKPKKRLNVALAGMAGLFIGIFIAFLMEGIEKRVREVA